MRATIAAVVIGALIAGCAHRRDDRMATSATGAAPAHPQPAYGAKVERSNRDAQTEDERLRASVRERYAAPAAKPARAPKPASTPKPATGAGGASHAATADRRLAARVNRSLASDAGTRGLKLGVHAQDGIVTLTGHVETAGQKQKALEIARRVAGAKHVRDAIQVGVRAPR